MRIGLIGDVHQEDWALAWALGRLADEGADWVVCVGDVADGYGSLDTACELLESHGVLTVRGNHDRWFLEQAMRDLPLATRFESVSETTRDWLRALPATAALPTPRGRLLVCHGMDHDDMAGLKPHDAGYALECNLPLQRLIREAEYSVVVAGHTHLPMQRQFGALTVVNAGTLHRDYEPCVGLLDLERMTTRFWPVPKPQGTV